MQIPNIETRLEVYKTSLEFLLNKEFDNNGTNIPFGGKCHPVYGAPNFNFGLCQVLPCVWLNCHYMTPFFDKKGNSFYWQDTKSYFPEFNNYFKNKNTRWDKEFRISILTEIINDIENAKTTN